MLRVSRYYYKQKTKEKEKEKERHRARTGNILGRKGLGIKPYFKTR